MKLPFLIALSILGSAQVFAQATTILKQKAYEPPQSDHCLAPGTLMNHEVPIIIEDGSIRVVAYKSHFDQNLLKRIMGARPVDRKPAPNAKMAIALGRLGSWHTHIRDHQLQIAVSSLHVPLGKNGTPIFKTKLSQISLSPTNRVEIQLAQGPNAVDSVWLVKEVDSALATRCHIKGEGGGPESLLAWKLMGVGTIRVPRDGVGGNSEFARLEYDPNSGKSGVLHIRGIRIWDNDPATDPSALPQAEVKLGSGCTAIQICPNGSAGGVFCKPMNPPCSLTSYKGPKLDPNVFFRVK